MHCQKCGSELTTGGCPNDRCRAQYIALPGQPVPEECPSCGERPAVRGGKIIHIQHCPVAITERDAADMARLRRSYDRLQEDSAEGL